MAGLPKPKMHLGERLLHGRQLILARVVLVSLVWCAGSRLLCATTDTHRLLTPLEGLIGESIPEASDPEVVAAIVTARFRVACFIVTLPDPVRSHLAQNFDRALDALQRAMEKDHFVLLRWELPWLRQTMPKDDTPSGAPDSSTPQSPRDSQTDEPAIPGLLVFQDAGDASALRLCFIVGETPSAGISLPPLVAALRYSNAFTRDAGECAIQILGPYFSGSASSLLDGLRLGGYPLSRYRCVSGSATVDTTGGILGPLHFETTVLSDQILDRAMAKYLERVLHAKKGNTALFVEGGTDYGAGAARSLPYRFRIPFPLNIAQLRGAYAATGGTPPSSRSMPRRWLDLALEPSTTATDIIPPYTVKMTTNADDLVLTRSLDLLRRERIQFIGIIASDTRDVLFLATKIRDSGIDALIFTFGADMIYTHPSTAAALRGSLVVTPYPLFPLSRHPPGSDSPWFPGTSEQGIYNALLVLAGSESLADYLPPPGIALDARQPPAWIMTVGRQGFWPVTLDDSTALPGTPSYTHDGSSLPRDPIDRDPHAISILPAWIATYTLLAILAALYLMLRAGHVGSPTSRLRRVGTWAGRADVVFSDRIRHFFKPCTQETACWINDSYFFGITSLATLTQLSITVLSGKIALISSTHNDTRIFAINISLLLVLCAVNWHERSHFHAGRRLGQRLGRGWEMIIVAGIVSIAVVRYLYHAATMGAADWFAFQSRGLDLLSGVTPLPVLALCLSVLVLWAACHVTRSLLHELYRGAEGSHAYAGTYFGGLVAIRKSIVDALGASRHRIPTYAYAVLAILPFYRLITKPFITLDGEYWNVAHQVLFLTCYVVILTTYAFFLVVWWALRRFLTYLSWGPLATSFQRLPPVLARSPWKMWHRPTTLRLLGAQTRCLRVLSNLSRRQLPVPAGTSSAIVRQQLRRSSDRAWPAWGKLRKSGTENAILEFSTYHDLDDALAGASGAVMPVLESLWTGWPVQKAAEATTDAATQSTVDLLEQGRVDPSAAWQRCAEDFLTLRAVGFIHNTFAHLRNLLSFSLTGLMLMLFAVAAYPVQPHHRILSFIWTVSVAAIATTVWSVIQMDRDVILSYMGKTAPGRATINRELISMILIYGVLPLATLFATQFPALGDYVVAFFNPSLRPGG